MYRPSKPLRHPPKLAHGACTKHVLLDMAWRRDEAKPCHSQKVNVEAYQSGYVYIDIPEVRTESSVLWVMLEGSPDTARWADLTRWMPYCAPGLYSIALPHVGPFLRLAYRVQGSVQFGAEWVGKRFEVGGAPSVIRR
jgi:hypothetical protein